MHVETISTTTGYLRTPVGHVLLAGRAWAPTLGLPMTDMERKKRISHAIREVREKRGFSRPELAALVGVGRGAVNDWENGVTLPSVLNLGPLCDALQVDADLFAHPPEIPESGITRYMLDERGKGRNTATG